MRGRRKRTPDYCYSNADDDEIDGFSIGGDANLGAGPTPEEETAAVTAAVVVGAPARKKRRRDGGGSGSGSSRSVSFTPDDDDYDDDGESRKGPARRGGGRSRTRPRPDGKALAGEMMVGSPVAGSGGDGGETVGGGGGGDGGGAAAAATVASCLAGKRPKQTAGTRKKKAAGVKADDTRSPPPSAAAAAEQHNPCTCKKCRCLKLYCDCFAQSRFCGSSCLCKQCCNRPGAAVVQAARRAVLERNPDAFHRAHNLETRPGSVTSGAGCGCTRSHCLKKYCVCFQKSLYCGAGCKCEGCLNTVENRGGLANPNGGAAAVKAATTTTTTTTTTPPPPQQLIKTLGPLADGEDGTVRAV
ncbi:unnamed protein product [Ectocarpus sp. 12 AP-2014]